MASPLSTDGRRGGTMREGCDIPCVVVVRSLELNVCVPARTERMMTSSQIGFGTGAVDGLAGWSVLAETAERRTCGSGDRGVRGGGRRRRGPRRGRDRG